MTLSYPYQPAIDRLCIVDGAQGVYVAQSFALRYGDQWNLDPDDLAILIDGVSCDESPWDSYWSTWDDVLSYARFIDSDGVIWRLEQDCDLFMIIDEE